MNAGMFRYLQGKMTDSDKCVNCPQVCMQGANLLKSVIAFLKTVRAQSVYC